MNILNKTARRILACTLASAMIFSSFVTMVFANDVNENAQEIGASGTVSTGAGFGDTGEALPYSLNIDFSGDLVVNAAEYDEAKRGEILLRGVSAQDENGETVNVWLDDDGGFNAAAQWPDNSFTLTYAAKHPVSEEVFTVQRRAVVIAQAGFTPTSTTPETGLVKVTFTAPASYNAWTAQNLLTLNLTVNMTKANIEGGTIEIPLDYVPDGNGTPPYDYFTMDAPVFIFDSVTDSDCIDHYEDKGDRLVIFLKNNLPVTQETFAVNFSFNKAAYLNDKQWGMIEEDVTLWEPKPEARVGGVAVNTADARRIINGGYTDPAVAFTHRIPLDENYVEGDVTFWLNGISFRTTNSCFDESFDNHVYIDIPIGFSANSAIMTRFPDGSSTTEDGYTRYIKNVNNNDTGFNEILNAGVTPPNDLEIGDEFTFRVGFAYKKLNGPKRETVNSITYKKSAPLGWAIYEGTFPSASNDSKRIICSVADNKTAKMSLSSGTSTYTANTTPKNTGNVAITGVKFVWSQTGAGSPKANINSLTLNLSRESLQFPWSKYRVVFTIVDADSGISRKEESSLLFQRDNISGGNVTVPLPALTPEVEYIETFEIIPMGVDGQSEGVWPVRNGITSTLRVVSWNGQKWPDGKDVPQNEQTLVPVEYRMEYNYNNAVSDRRIYGPDTAYVRYVPDYTSFGNSYLTNVSGQSDFAPGDVAAYEITGGNNDGYALSGWEDPRVVIRLPVQIELVDADSNKDLVIKYKDEIQETRPSSVTVEKVGSDSLYNYYSFQVNGYSLPADRYANFSIPVQLRIAVGTSPATYAIPTVSSSKDSSRFFRYQDAAMYNLPDNQNIADYGLGADENYFYNGGSNIKVRSAASLTAATSVKSQSTGGVWVSANNTIAPARHGETVEVRVSLQNKGNTDYKTIKIYNILPFNGDPLGSTGAITLDGVDFVGLTAGQPAISYATTHFNSLPKYGDFDSGKELIIGNRPAATWNGNISNATAIYVDFGSNIIPIGQSLDIIFRFNVPADIKIEETAFIHYVYQAVPNIAGGAVLNANSPKAGFSTETISLVYDANLPSGAVDSVVNMPANASDSFMQSGDTLTISSGEPTLTGYSFEGWYNQATGGEKVNAGQAISFTEAGTKTLYARWKIVSVTVIFNKNGGDTEANPGFKAFDFGHTVTASDIPAPPTRGGYDFGGWSEAQNGANIDFDVGTVINFTGTKTLYAIWNPDGINYAVTYDKNTADIITGNLPVDNSAYIYNDSVNISTDTIGRTGYIFKGWSRTGKLPVETSFNIKLNTTLYAIWEAIPYTVTYEPGERGTFTAQVASNLVYGDTTPTAPATPGENGWTFTGWDSEPAAIVTKNAVYIAQWSQNQYTVTYEPGERGTFTAQVASNLIYGDTTPTAPATPGENGWTFTGWDTEPVAIVTQNAVYIAQWSQNQYTVAYDKNTTDTIAGTIPVDSKLYIYGDTVTVSTDAIGRAGHTFDGWSLTSDGTAATSFSITQNTTLYARWTTNIGGGDNGGGNGDGGDDGDDGGGGGPDTSDTIPDPIPAPIPQPVPTPEPPPTPGPGGGGITGTDSDPDSGSDSTPDTDPAPGTTESEPKPDRESEPTSTQTPTVPATLPIQEGTLIQESLTPLEQFLQMIEDGEVPLISIGGIKIPLFAPLNSPVWALVNLILCALGALLAIITVIRVLLRKKHERSDSTDVDEDEDEKEAKHNRHIWLAIAVIMGIVGVIVFLFTENMDNIMTLVDMWTIVNAAIFALEIVAILLIFRHTRETVAFETNDGGEVFRQKIRAGEALKEPKAPVKENHIFAGWFMENSFETRWNFDDSVGKSFTLYAKWNEIRVIDMRDDFLAAK